MPEVSCKLPSVSRPELSEAVGGSQSACFPRTATVMCRVKQFPFMRSSHWGAAIASASEPHRVKGDKFSDKLQGGRSGLCIMTRYSRLACSSSSHTQEKL